VPRPHTTMRKIRYVLRLRLDDQLSLRQVSASLAMPHTTVADYVRRAAMAGLTTWPLPEELADDDALESRLFGSVLSAPKSRAQPDFAKMKTDLAKKAMTKALLWVEYREEHPGGYEYSQFCQLYRDWRKTLDVTMRQDHKAGEKLFVDFPGLTIPIYDERDLTVSFKAELFVAALGASSYLYAEALRSQELVHWCHAHENAFEHFGGCPEICVPDNLRSGVTKPNRYEPDVNATYQEMAEHYGVVIIPARPYKPRDKAKAEAGVQLVERWIIMRLRKERFTSLGALNDRIFELVELLNNRPFKKMEGSRASVFAEIDQPALRPLPTTRYDFATWTKAKVSLDYHLQIDRNFYSVPYTLVGQVLDVRTSANVVEVFAKNRRVASHKRSYLKGIAVTDPAHMPSSHRRHAQWTPSRIVHWAEKTGPSTAAFIEALMAARPHPEQGFRSALGVLRLEKKYGISRLEAACARSLAIHSLSYKSVSSILKHGLEQRPLAAVASRANPTHSNIRGAGYYQ
jgi:transposase